MNKRSTLIGILALVVIAAAIGITKFVMKTKTMITTTFAELETQIKQDSTPDPLNYDFSPQVLYNNAMLLDLKSDTLVDQIEDVKNFLIDVSLVSDDTDFGEASSKNKISQLKDNISNHRNWIDSLYPGYVVDLNELFNTGDQRLNDKMIPWEEYYFQHGPLSAVVTILTHYQSKVRSIEATIMDSLKSTMDAVILDNRDSEE